MPVTESLPVISRIGQELFDRLKRLEADYSDFLSISEVVRPLRLGQYTPKHLQIVLTKGDAERVPELDCFGNPPAIAWRQRFDIRCHVMPSERDDTPLDTYNELMQASVVKTVCDASQWHTFGGVAVNAEWDQAELIDSDGGPAGINVPILITYRTDEGNPFNARA